MGPVRLLFVNTSPASVTNFIGSRQGKQGVDGAELSISTRACSSLPFFTSTSDHPDARLAASAAQGISSFLGNQSAYENGVIAGPLNPL